MYFKNILLFIFILFLWLLSGFIFKFNKEYYDLLRLPSFVLNGKLISIIFMYFFFYLMSPFLGFAITTVVMLSTIFLFLETKKISKKSSYFLVPYIIYSIYAFILMSTVYFMNF